MLSAVRFSLPVALAFATLAACGGGTSPTATSPAGATPTTQPAASTAGGGDFAAVCRDLENLTSLDYAFGKSFAVVSALDDASKALTLQHVQSFATEAPPELSTAATDLVGLWTDLVNDPSSVTESDPRWAEATDSISAWRTQNCV